MSEALSMGGYGVYVWGSFGFALAVVIWNAIAPARERRAILRQLSEESDD